MNFTLIHFKTALTVLIKTSRWKLKYQLFLKVLDNLKNAGKRQLSMINEINEKCIDAKKQIKELMNAIMENVKQIGSNESSSSIYYAFNIIIKIVEIVIFNRTINSPMFKKTEQSHDQTMDLINYLMVFEHHWNNFNMFFSCIALRFNSILNERIDTMIEQTLFNDCSDLISIERLLIRSGLSHIYKELGTLLVLFRVYIDISSEFLLKNFDNLSFIQSQTNILTVNCIASTSSVQMQVKEFIQECQRKYTSIFQQQIIQFDELLNELSHSV